METFSALLAICAGNSPVPGEFPTQRPVTRSFDVYFDLRPNKRLSKQTWDWLSETPSRPLWRHCNGIILCSVQIFDRFVVLVHYIYIYMCVCVRARARVCVWQTDRQTEGIHFFIDSRWHIQFLLTPEIGQLIRLCMHRYSNHPMFSDISKMLSGSFGRKDPAPIRRWANDCPKCYLIRRNMSPFIHDWQSLITFMECRVLLFHGTEYFLDLI